MKGSSKTKNDPKQIEFDFAHVKAEPELQMQVATWPPRRRREFADKLERWVHQLRVTADVLEHRAHMHASTLPRIKRLPESKLVLN